MTPDLLFWALVVVFVVVCVMEDSEPPYAGA